MTPESHETNDEALNAAPAQPEAAVQKESKPLPADKTKPQVSGFQRFVRSALTWLIVVVIAFLAGVSALFFTRYQPLGAMLAQTQGELAQANQRVSQLKAEVTAVNNQLASATAERDAAVAHLGLQQVLVDVTNARLALLKEDVPAAKAALKDTAAKLDAITPQIANADAGLAESMPQRLALILTELDSDVETAKTDLELLSGNLLNVETLLFEKE